MNDTAFNVLCNIAQTISREQNLVLDMEITDDGILARVIPIEFVHGLDEEDYED